MVGARSAFLVLRGAFYGTTRFDDFAERAGISQPVAAAGSVSWSTTGSWSAGPIGTRVSAAGWSTG